MLYELASNIRSMYSYLLNAMGSVNGWFFRQSTQVPLIAFTCNGKFVTSRSCQSDSGAASAIHHR